MATETIFFEGNLVQGALILDDGKVVVEVLDEEDDCYYFSFILEPVPGPDPRKVRVSMHRRSSNPPLINIETE